MKTDGRIIPGMIMLEDNSPFKLGLFLDDIKETCEYKVGKPSGDENATTLNMDGELSWPISEALRLVLGDA